MKIKSRRVLSALLVLLLAVLPPAALASFAADTPGAASGYCV
jgi:hypothetical protein